MAKPGPKSAQTPFTPICRYRFRVSSKTSPSLHAYLAIEGIDKMLEEFSQYLVQTGSPYADEELLADIIFKAMNEGGFQPPKKPAIKKPVPSRPTAKVAPIVKKPEVRPAPERLARPIERTPPPRYEEPQYEEPDEDFNINESVEVIRGPEKSLEQIRDERLARKMAETSNKIAVVGSMFGNDEV